MKFFATNSLLALLLTPAVSLAAPCVSEGFDRPIPGATHFEIVTVDVPSARHPHIWQEGTLSSYHYRVFPDGRASLAAGRTRPSWMVNAVCDEDDQMCVYTAKGDLPPNAYEVASVLGRCLLGDKPIIRAADSQNTTDQNEQEASRVCPNLKIPDGGKVATLQRLLVEAGTDPGPVDGFIGPATLNALASIWKSPDTALDLDKAANALREIICENAG